MSFKANLPNIIKQLLYMKTLIISLKTYYTTHMETVTAASLELTNT